MCDNCSEVVERLAKLADELLAQARSASWLNREKQLTIFRAKSEAILHEWREQIKETNDNPKQPPKTTR